jgi:amino acid adenylation domain-containing protein
MNKKVLYTVIDAVSTERGLAPAIETSKRTFSYDELRGYSNSIAHTLLDLGVTKGEVIGLYLGSGASYVSGTLAINKAGGIFMPLELAYPVKRLMYLLETVKLRIIITDAQGREAFLSIIKGSEYEQSLHQFLLLDDEALTVSVKGFGAFEGTEEVKKFNPGPVDVLVDGDDANYLLYTSGSTGFPKIIEGCHKGLSHFVHWEVKEFGLDHNSRVSQLVPLSFDVSLRDIFTPLLAGGVLCVPDDGVKTSPLSLIDWFGSSGVTLIHTVPSLFRLVTRELQNNQSLLQKIQALKFVLLSGEALYGKDVLAWRKAVGSKIELVNLYGPTETTLAKIFNRIGDEVDDPGGIIPLGNPLPNTSVIILDKNALCQIGDIGEIHIKTPFRSRGYYKNDELTKDCFIQNPLQDESEDIVYRTGDLGKYLPDRSIAFVGRQDSQVKIRGNRVELSETERAMHRYPGIEQVVVLAIKKADESDMLASYFVSSGPIDNNALRAYLKEFLPDYMHPSYFIELDEFPLNLNGKINKKALPRPEELLYENKPYVAPSNLVEEQLAGIWGFILGLKKVGVTNSFFDLGGHSLSAIKVISRIYQQLGLEISLKDFFDHATITSLARFLSTRSAGTYSSINILPVQEHYELSAAQKLMWVLDQSSSDMIAYNMPASCILNGPVNKEALRKAFRTLIDRHETLRTTFKIAEGEPRQFIQSDLAFTLDENDISVKISYDGKSQYLINKYLEEEFSLPFNLVNGPLIRARLVKLKNDQHLFLFTMHHIISDGWSRGLLLKELMVLYAAYNQGKPNPLQPLRVQYKDYAAWQNALLSGDQLQASRTYWHQKLAGELPVINLPVDYARESTRSYAGDTIRFTLSKKESDQVRQLCSEQKVSLFVFFVTVINVFLYKQTGQKDIIVGTTIASRNNPDIEGLIGLFLNSIVLRNELNRRDKFKNCLQNVKKTVLEAYENQLYPLETLLNELNIEKIENRNPLYDVLVVLNNSGLADLENDRIDDTLHVEAVDVQEGISKFDLTFFISEEDDLGISIEYSTELFKAETILRMKEEFIKLVNIITSNDEQTLNAILWALPGGCAAQISNRNNQLISEEF